MHEETQQNPASMSKEELERTMRTLEPMYDLVRIVDPSITQGRTLAEGGELGLPHCCFDLLEKGRRCRNCISARTVAHQHSISKFELVDQNAFYISTRYVEVDGKPCSLELVKQIENDTLVQGDDPSSPDGLRSLVEEDERSRYASAIAGVLSRGYIEDGVGSLTASRVALLHVEGLAKPQSPAEQDHYLHVLSIAAARTSQLIRTVDTLVRYEDETFAILFEGIPAHLFHARLQQIRENVLDALSQEGLQDNTDVVLGGVAKEGEVSELLKLAEEALLQAKAATQRLCILYDNDQESPQDSTAGVPALGAAQHSVDALTRLPLPRVFRKQLARRISRLDSGNETLTVLHLDIENFKAFNRAYGLSEGDLLLVSLASAIREAYPSDLVTRAGVDMFVVATQAADALDRVDRLRERMVTLRRDVAIELKIGVFEVRDPAISARAAMDRAKIACDSIKGMFDRNIRSFDERLEHQVNTRDYIVRSLDEALKSNRIQPYYQAIVRSFTKQACATEALSRWIDPKLGILSPADVIPTLERHHLIHKHDVHIVRRVCHDLRSRIDAGLPVVPASVNLSRLDFELCDIFSEVEDAVATYGIDRGLLGIEVTESTLDKSNEFFRPQVERFRNAGYEIWMDDFGSGYSSLSLLKDYEFDVLKIDMAFLRGLESNQNSKEIISSVVDMAKRLGIHTLAEGVETQEQFNFLRSIGCEMIQGYLFSKPSPLDHLDLDGNVDVEDAACRDYFDSIGRVNLLSQKPAEGMPLAVVEWDGSRLHFLNANETYLQKLCERGFGDVSDAEESFNEDAERNFRVLAPSATLVAKAGHTHAYLVSISHV